MGQKLSLKKFGDLIDTSIAVDQRTTIEFEKEEISQIAYDSRDIIPSDGACLFFAHVFFQIFDSYFLKLDL